MSEQILEWLPDVADARDRLRRLLRAALGLLLLLALVVAGYLAWFRLMGNFHAVVPGQVYRSGQLGTKALQRQIARYKLRSILNLRGGHPGDDWYDSERVIARARGLRHYTVDFSARHMIDASRIDAVLDLIEQAPKPLLIHCNAGADRSGLVSAALLLRQGATPREADRQLSLWYGHFPWLGSRTVAMDRSYWRYVEQQQANLGAHADLRIAVAPTSLHATR